jgi:hypothetical protein
MKLDLSTATLTFTRVKDSRDPLLRFFVGTMGDLNVFRIQQATVCEVEGEGVSGFGVAFCSRIDEYKPLIGMRKALKRALGNVPREQRKRIWGEYNKLLTRAAIHAGVI